MVGFKDGLPATNAFFHNLNEPSCLYTSATEHHCILAGIQLPCGWQ